MGVGVGRARAGFVFPSRFSLQRPRETVQFCLSGSDLLELESLFWGDAGFLVRDGWLVGLCFLPRVPRKEGAVVNVDLLQGLLPQRGAWRPLNLGNIASGSQRPGREPPQHPGGGKLFAPAMQRAPGPLSLQ